MNYKLAKALKDAGFSQKGEYKLYPNDGIHEEVVMPTLSELIEACGERLWSITNFQGWEAQAKWPEFQADGGESLKGFGKTPEEAVAKLWLELSKK